MGSETTRRRFSSALKQYYFGGKNTYLGLRRVREDDASEPVFILGCGRSGNTLMRSLLVASGSVAIPPESYVLGTLVSEFGGLVLNSNDIIRVLGKLSGHPEFKRWGLSDGDLATVYSEAPSGPTLGNVLSKLYTYQCRQLLNANELTRWGDKSPINSLYAGALRRHFPRAQFLHMVRNPLDVAVSYVSYGLLPTYEDALDYWGLANTRIQESLTNSSAVLRVHFEDFTENPSLVGNEVFRFLNLDIDFSSAVLRRNEIKSFLGDVSDLRHHSQVNAVEIHPAGLSNWKEQVSPACARKIMTSLKNKYPECSTLLRRYEQDIVASQIR